jgi:hypothetical protein
LTTADDVGCVVRGVRRILIATAGISDFRDVVFTDDAASAAGGPSNVQMCAGGTS